MIRHVASVGEIVEDLPKAIAFYESLGITVNDVGGYAILEVPGVLHFGVWTRAAAAESIYGTADAADRVPLGFHVEFEVDDISTYADVFGERIVHGDRTEPWGQKVLRYLAPSGVPCSVAETPSARELAHDVEGKAPTPA